MKNILEELSEISNDYVSAYSFTTNNNNISVSEFEYYSINKFSLFLIHENFDFELLNDNLKNIESTLPSIKRIFIKPIIHLIDEEEVLPVEAVKLINNKTINHISVHSEYWDDIVNDGIKPLKLMTKVYKDNYSIYENQVFAKTIDTIIAYIRKNIRYLKNMMYTSKILSTNLLDRLNHINYYIAVGKLHTSYVRNFSKNYDIALNCLNRMNYILDILTSRLKRNVYRLNKNYPRNLKLHNSNILHMQKDYHKIYNLLKCFNESKIGNVNINMKNINSLYNHYYEYIKILTIFSILHFNFESDPKQIIDFKKLDLKFYNNEYKLNISSHKNGILLKFEKDIVYEILLVLFDRNGNLPENIDNVIISPVALSCNCLHINIDDIDSFRKIQRILLKGMIYSTTDFGLCPFCNEHLYKQDGEQTFYCKSCRTIIIENKCPTLNKKYYSTDIDNIMLDKDIEEEIDISYHYRNITNLTFNKEIICPYCNKNHK